MKQSKTCFRIFFLKNLDFILMISFCFLVFITVKLFSETLLEFIYKRRIYIDYSNSLLKFIILCVPVIIYYILFPIVIKYKSITEWLTDFEFKNKNNTEPKRILSFLRNSTIFTTIVLFFIFITIDNNDLVSLIFLVGGFSSLKVFYLSIINLILNIRYENKYFSLSDRILGIRII